ncbi:MAG: toxin secretion/phage lysis holin [Eubacterium sp.]|nr:toxin secretion/phage lysis holin [Eubacterium sp.]
MENVNAFKVTLTAIFAGVSAMLGWFGWLIVAFIACLVADWISGSAAAAKNGQWSSQKGREGIWHKAGCIVVVIVAAVLDGVIGSIINNIPSISLPFTYTVLLCPIIVVWYILTELGSIVENAAKMGAPIPDFLKSAISLFKGTVDAAGNKITDNTQQLKPPNNF